MKDKIKEILGTVAPKLASAFGGPLAGMATQVIGDKLLGKSDAPLNEIEQAISNATPQDLIKLKEIETAFLKDMKAAGVELTRIAADDRESARARAIAMKDWTPTALGLVIIIGFFGILIVMMFWELPSTTGDILKIMLGALGALVTQVANYFFGSSVGSKRKTEMIDKMKEAF